LENGLLAGGVCIVEKFFLALSRVDEVGGVSVHVLSRILRHFGLVDEALLVAVPIQTLYLKLHVPNYSLDEAVTLLLR